MEKPIKHSPAGARAPWGHVVPSHLDRTMDQAGPSLALTPESLPGQALCSWLHPNSQQCSG